jgi:mRNA interferase MazF
MPLTSNLKWAAAPGNVLLPAQSTGLPKDSVANVSQILALDRSVLIELVGQISSHQLQTVLTGLETILRR